MLNQKGSLDRNKCGVAIKGVLAVLWGSTNRRQLDHEPNQSIIRCTFISLLSNQSNRISPSQFMNRLLLTSTSTTQQSQLRQQSRQQFTNHQHEYVFFNSLPEESLIISSMQQIDGDGVMFVARSFHGLIVYVSINRKERNKADIVKRFVKVMRGRVLYVVIDSIGYAPEDRGRIPEHELIAISQTADCIYLLRETDYNLSSQCDNYVRYQIYYNSLLQKYIHYSQFSYLQSRLPILIQSLLQYFFALMREQLSLLYSTFYNELSLIKGVIELNYNRKLQRQQNKNYELKQFQDFIHFHHYITQFMLDNSLHPTLFHFSTKLPISRHCYYCKVYKNANKSTLYTCGRCQSEYGVTIPLCPECMEPFHQIKDRLKIIENFQSSIKNSQKNQSQLKIATQSCVGINLLKEQQKNSNFRSQYQPKRIKHYTSRLSGKSRFTKKITHVHKKKKLHLTLEQLSNLRQLQQSGQRLIDIFRQFKNPNTFYKPFIDNPTNTQELKYQLKSQLDLMKVIQMQLQNEIEMFEGEMMMQIHKQEQNQQVLNGMVKIEHIQHNDQQQHIVSLPMVKIEQQSNQSCDYDCFGGEYVIHNPNIRKSTALSDD